jgi:hypothetical protein
LVVKQLQSCVAAEPPIWQLHPQMLDILLEMFGPAVPAPFGRDRHTREKRSQADDGWAVTSQFTKFVPLFIMKNRHNASTGIPEKC